MTDLALCLCCGARYGPDDDCPNLDRLPHSAERAADVARYLLDRGCEHARPLDVRLALYALDALSER